MESDRGPRLLDAVLSNWMFSEQGSLSHSCNVKIQSSSHNPIDKTTPFGPRTELLRIYVYVYTYNGRVIQRISLLIVIEKN